MVSRSYRDPLSSVPVCRRLDRRQYPARSARFACKGIVFDLPAGNNRYMPRFAQSRVVPVVFALTNFCAD
jgi:hypothetical protein